MSFVKTQDKTNRSSLTPSPKGLRRTPSIDTFPPFLRGVSNIAHVVVQDARRSSQVAGQLEAHFVHSLEAAIEQNAFHVLRQAVGQATAEVDVLGHDGPAVALAGQGQGARGRDAGERLLRGEHAAEVELLEDLSVEGSVILRPFRQTLDVEGVDTYEVLGVAGSFQIGSVVTAGGEDVLDTDLLAGLRFHACGGISDVDDVEAVEVQAHVRVRDRSEGGNASTGVQVVELLIVSTTPSRDKGYYPLTYVGVSLLNGRQS